jgi:hypothetical protein
LAQRLASYAPTAFPGVKVSQSSSEAISPVDIELAAALFGADLRHALGHFLAEPFEKIKSCSSGVLMS